MKPKLLNILVDPLTKEPLTLKNAVYIKGEIEKGELFSPSGSSFPIRNGIPRFVSFDNYSNSFGLQWNRFAKTQLDSATGMSYSRKRFENDVRWTKEWAADKWILDAGCGAGRFAEIAAQLDCNLVALDMSSAIDAAKDNLFTLRNVDFVQANLLHLPFRKSTFEGLYCIGVLQHTPDPYKVLRLLLEVLLPQGRFAFTIYAKRPWTKLYSKYWIRTILNGISDEKLLNAIEKIMPIAFPVTDALFRIPLLGKLFGFLIPIANYVQKTDLTKEQRYEEAVLDTFDMLSPKFDYPVIAEHIVDVIIKCGIDNYKVITSRPVNIIGKKA